jgi:formate dehydrogenase iron-sulfur subunit
MCNAGYCVAGPFGVIERLTEVAPEMHLLRPFADGMELTCAKACLTDSIVSARWRNCARLRLNVSAQLHARGVEEAYLYGASAQEQPGTGGLNAFFLLVDRPEVYNLPPDPVAPAMKAKGSWTSLALASLGIFAAAVGAVVASRTK